MGLPLACRTTANSGPGSGRVGIDDGTVSRRERVRMLRLRQDEGCSESCPGIRTAAGAGGGIKQSRCQPLSAAGSLRRWMAMTQRGLPEPGFPRHEPGDLMCVRTDRMITNPRATTPSNPSRPFGPHALQRDSCNAVPTRYQPLSSNAHEGRCAEWEKRHSFGAADPNQIFAGQPFVRPIDSRRRTDDAMT